MKQFHYYYMTQRPPQIGAMPRRGLSRIIYINVDESREYVPEIGKKAYAKLEYDHKLTEQEISNYELTKGE